MQKAYALFWGARRSESGGRSAPPTGDPHLNPPDAAYFFASFFARSCSSFSAIFISSPLLTGL